MFKAIMGKAIEAKVAAWRKRWKKKKKNVIPPKTIEVASVDVVPSRGRPLEVMEKPVEEVGPPTFLGDPQPPASGLAPATNAWVRLLEGFIPLVDKKKLLVLSFKDCIYYLSYIFTKVRA